MIADHTENVVAVAKQIGGELLPDNPQWHNRFRVKSSTSSSLYVIAQRESDDTWGCSCPGWRHYRRCKHLTDVLQRLAGVVVSATFDPTTIAMLTSARAALLDLDATKDVAAPKLKGRIVDLT